jgi:hypothetical protein
MENSVLTSISNTTLCNWTYGLFVWQSIMVAFALLGVFGAIFMGSNLGLPKGLRIFQSFVMLLAAGIAAASALFLYLICDRSLLATKEQAK